MGEYALGEFGDLFARFLDDLGIGLFLNARLASILRNKTQPGSEHKNHGSPACGFSEREGDEFARLDFLRMTRGIVHHEIAPRSGRLGLGEFERGAHAFLEILFHVHPAGGFGEAGFAPEAEDEADKRAKNRGDARPADDVGRNGRELESSESNEEEQSADEQSDKQPAQTALDTATTRGAGERCLDDLKFAHGLRQVEPTIENRRVNLARIFHKHLAERRSVTGFTDCPHPKPVTDRCSTLMPIQATC